MKRKRKIDYPCSTCGAKPGEHCQSSLGKKTDVHGPRRQQWNADREQREHEREKARKKQEQDFFDEWPEGVGCAGDGKWRRHVKDEVTTWIRSDPGISCRVRDTGQAWRWEVCIDRWCTDTGRDRIIDAGYVTTTLSAAQAAAWAIVESENEAEDEDEDGPRTSTEGW